MSRIEQIITEIEDYIDSCKFQPLSNTKILVNKEEIEELLVELRLRIPEEIKKYQKIISNQDAILQEARSQADAMVAEATAQTNELVNEHEIMQRAYAEANSIIEQANAQAQQIVDKQYPPGFRSVHGRHAPQPADHHQAFDGGRAEPFRVLHEFDAVQLRCRIFQPQ